MRPEVISVAAALAGVVVGQLLSRSGEYRKWLRAERHKAGAELLAAGEALREAWRRRCRQAELATRLGRIWLTWNASA